MARGSPRRPSVATVERDGGPCSRPLVRFPSTVWSRIRSGEHVAERYREPIYRFLLARGLSVDDARDLAQDVFVQILKPGFLEKANASQGRFRNLLLAVTVNVLTDWQRRKSAKRRGGGQQTSELDEETLSLDPSGQSSPDRLFDRLWADTLLQRAIERLCSEHPRYGRVIELVYLEGKTYEDTAAELGMDVDQVRNAAHRGKSRLREAMKRDVRAYCSSEAELRAELLELRNLLA